jgi:polyphosphate glucokinase
MGLRFNRVLSLLEIYFPPNLMILGGGFIENYKDFASHLALDTNVVPAKYRNEASIVGEAIVARESVI